MRKILGLCCFALSLSCSFTSAVFGQANNGGREKLPVMGVDFYKVQPAKQDEWLALYKKWHYPIMQWYKSQGLVISETVYTRVSHQVSPSWDFCIIIITPAPSEGKKAPLTRAQVIRKLFPNLDEYVKGEKERWSLVTEHWDEQWTTVDIDKNPSLYYPAEE